MVVQRSISRALERGLRVAGAPSWRRAAAGGAAGSSSGSARRTLFSSGLARPAAAGASIPSYQTLSGARRSFAEIYYSPPAAVIEEPAPDFDAKAVVDGEITSLSLEDFRGSWTVLLFYPKDFTFVCPTEIIAFSDRKKEFDKLNAKVLAISTDTEETHLAWTQVPRKRGGLGFMQIPLVADTTKAISADYGVLIQEGGAAGIALRGLFIIDPKGNLKQITINNLDVGRSVDETLRLLSAYQFVEEHGVVCPAGWKPGDKAMYGDPERSQEYFASGATEEADEDDPFEPSENMVVIKSKQDYLEVLKEPKSIINFSAPWCGKCRQIFPLYRELTEANPSITFAKFDTTNDSLESLTTELGVKALPAFHFYAGGKEIREPVIGYKKKMLASAVEELHKK